MTTRITVFFEPLDVLQFRDHRPFDMGAHVVANTVFPRPSTFRGALRSLLFRMFEANFGDDGEHFGITEPWACRWLGGRRKDGTLAMRGPLLARRAGSSTSGRLEPLFRAAQDLVTVKTNGSHEPNVGSYQILEPIPEPSARPLMRLRWSKGGMRQVQGDLPWIDTTPGKEKPDKICLTAAGARAYFAAAGSTLDLLPTKKEKARIAAETGKPPPELAIWTEDVLRREDRVGIARSPDTLAAEDAMFYITSPFRLKEGYGFAVDVAIPEEGADQAKQALWELNGAVAALGGKGHRARLGVFDQSVLAGDDALAPEAKSGPCKVWLQTPLPLTGPLPDGSLVVADRPIPIGGFDFARGAPRALRPALPAGTIIHLPEGASWPLSPTIDVTGYGFALVGPVESHAPAPEGEHR